MDVLEIYSTVVNRVSDVEVYFRGYDSGIMCLNVFERGVKKVYYTKLGGEISFGGFAWVCVDLFPPKDNNIGVHKLMARFVRKEPLH